MSVIPAASVVTEKTWSEFLLTRFSLQQYHRVEWFISCDPFVQEKVKQEGFDNVTCLVNIENDDCTHNTADTQQRDQWMKIMMTKFDACERAFQGAQKVMFLDSDMLFVNGLGPRIIGLLLYSDIDGIISPHMTNNPSVEAKHGYYNAGMFVMKSRDFLNDWRLLSQKYKELGMYFEQQPLEFAHRNYVTANFPINYNIGWWRFNHATTRNRLNQIRIVDDSIYFGNKPAVNFHIHTLKTKKTDTFSNELKDLVFKNLQATNNPKYKELLGYYENLRSHEQVG